jgi:hypothetical protein
LTKDLILCYDVKKTKAIVLKLWNFICHEFLYAIIFLMLKSTICFLHKQHCHHNAKIENSVILKTGKEMTLGKKLQYFSYDMKRQE